MRYPVRLRPDGKYLLVRFPDVPEAITQGDSIEDALHHALDALETVFMYAEEVIPMPSVSKRGQKFVDLPPSVAAKVLLHNEMVRRKIRPTELARRMGISQKEAERVMSLKYRTKIDTTQQAFKALGKRLELCLA